MSRKTVMEELRSHQEQAALLESLDKCAEAIGSHRTEEKEPEPLPDLMDTLYRRKQREARLKHGLQRGVNILAACMALAILGSILAFVCSAEVRGFLFRQIVSFGDGFISFNAKELPDDLQPEYLPSGYICIDSKSDSGTVIANFSNGTGGEFSLSKEKAESNNIYDYEKDLPSDSELVLINGEDGYFWRREDIHMLVWLQNGYFYSLIGALPQHEMLKVAESL